MNEILFIALKKLFVGFEQYGNYPDGEVLKVLAVIIIRDMLEMDVDGYLTDRDIRQIEKAIECLMGEGCLLPLKVNCCR